MARLLGTVSSSVQKSFGSFDSIATATGTGSSGTITFSSIPSTYQHLQIRINSISSSANQFVYVRFNSDTTSSYRSHYLNGNGGSISAGSGSMTNAAMIWGERTGSIATYPMVFVIDIHDYGSSTKNKTIKYLAGAENNTINGTGQIELGSGLWTKTNAINTISIITDTNWTTDSTFALYGIKGA